MKLCIRPLIMFWPADWEYSECTGLGTRLPDTPPWPSEALDRDILPSAVILA